MQLMLSAPSPSEAAKFIGQIFSIIISIIFERFPEARGLLLPSGDFDPLFVDAFDGDCEPAFFPLEPEELFIEDLCLLGLGKG